MSNLHIFSKSHQLPGSVVVKLYRSADEIRGYVRKVAEPGSSDSIFPGEEMEPDAALRLAQDHSQTSTSPIYVELSEGVAWNDRWGDLQRN